MCSAISSRHIHSEYKYRIHRLNFYCLQCIIALSLGMFCLSSFFFLLLCLTLKIITFRSRRPDQLKRCVSCKFASYCDRKCQVVHYIVNTYMYVSYLHHYVELPNLTNAHSTRIPASVYTYCTSTVQVFYVAARFSYLH